MSLGGGGSGPSARLPYLAHDICAQFVVAKCAKTADDVVSELGHGEHVDPGGMQDRPLQPRWQQHRRESLARLAREQSLVLAEVDGRGLKDDEVDHEPAVDVVLDEG